MEQKKGQPRARRAAVEAWFASKGRVFNEIPTGIERLQELFPANKSLFLQSSPEDYRIRCLATAYAYQYVMNIAYCASKLNQSTSDSEREKWAQELNGELMKFDASVR